MLSPKGKNDMSIHRILNFILATRCTIARSTRQNLEPVSQDSDGKMMDVPNGMFFAAFEERLIRPTEKIR